jgi:hypothetical protein
MMKMLNMTSNCQQITLILWIYLIKLYRNVRNA